MTNRKNTQRALVASALAVLLCVSMLVGSTFAWFTDNATTKVNTIQAGTLKIKLLDEEGNDLEGKPLEFANVNGETDILLEPGATFRTNSFKVHQDGNLAFKYKIAINGIDGDEKLLPALEFKLVDTENKETVDLEKFVGDSKDFTGTWEVTFDPETGKNITTMTEGLDSAKMYLEVHMKEEAGNEYMGLTIDGIAITVVATQDTVEFDSYDDQYDAEATYPVVVNDQDGLAAALENVKPGDILALDADSSYELPSKLPDGVKIDGNGATVAIPADGNFSRLYAEDVAIYDAVIEGKNIVTSGNVSFVECTFNGNLNNAEPADLVSFTDCTFNADVHFASGSGEEVPGSNFVATNCVFNKMVTLADFENATFTKCTFKGNNWAGKNVITYVNVGVNTFDSCTFTTGIRAASGMTADDFVIKNCNITIKDVSNLS